MTLADVAVEPDLDAPPPDAAPPAADEPAAEEAGSPVRDAVAMAFPSIGAGVMAGGIFLGVSPRIYASIAAVLGVALALAVRRVARPQLGTALILLGLVAIGPLLLVPRGLDAVAHVVPLVRAAARAGSVLRPPVPFAPGWQAVLGWLLGTTGFLAAWIATALKRPALALLLPLPVAAIAGISVPKSAQGASGVAVLVLFVVALGLLSGSRREDRLPLRYELRRAAQALPIVAVIVVVLVLLLRANVLFPKSVINPAQEPQKPKTVPLSDVEDRVLFRVTSEISGPWRTGSLDVYDGNDWRLPPFADNRLETVPKSGVVDPELSRGVRADFQIEGLTGAVLPGLPNTVGIVATGPKLSYDSRSGNIRTTEGQVSHGLRYSVVAAALPTIADLTSIASPVIPKALRPFVAIPPAPNGVKALILTAPSASKWAQFDFLRNYVLDNVVATGTGVPRSIDPDRAEEILTRSKEASPFEIVAVQAMLARWLGLPSRIGYGFDGGERVGNALEVHPSNGATFVEVWFPGYKWLPVIGAPHSAKPSLDSDKSSQRPNPNIIPSDDVSVKVFAFEATAPRGTLLAQIRRVVFVVVPALALAALAWLLWPLAAKARRRSRRHREAVASGPRARIALAYSEWRDLAADFGADFRGDTPLLFLNRTTPDEEHRQLAWLATRALWGDLAGSLTPELADQAEFLSRALQRRLSRAQPVTLRLVARLSRRSLRSPFEAEERTGRTTVAA
jgi:hypothetical protein